MLLPAEPHPNGLLHVDAGAGPVLNLVLHWGEREEDESGSVMEGKEGGEMERWREGGEEGGGRRGGERRERR